MLDGVVRFCRYVIILIPLRNFYAVVDKCTRVSFFGRSVDMNAHFKILNHGSEQLAKTRMELLFDAPCIRRHERHREELGNDDIM